MTTLANYVLPDKMPYAEYRAMAIAYCEARGIPIPRPMPSRPY